MDEIVRLTAVNVWQDIFASAEYILPGIISGIICVLFVEILGRITSKGKAALVLWKKGMLFLTVVYNVVLLNLTFFSREPGSRMGIDMQLFSTWGQDFISHSYFIENILLFIPFGLLYPCMIRQMRKSYVCIITGFFISILLEGMQLVFQRGYCQLDDVVTNTAGTIIGWLIFKAIASCFFKKSKH